MIGTVDAIVAHFNDPQTKQTSVFVENAGVHSDSWSSSANELAATDSGTSRWISDSTSQLIKDVLSPALILDNLLQRFYTGKKLLRTTP